MIRPTPSTVPPPVADCPLTLCVDYISSAWTPHILWYLRHGPRRFGDLRRDLDGVSAKVLTTRLRELEERLMIRRAVVPTSPPTTEYSLTELGERFSPILDAIVAVGHELKQARREDMQTVKPHIVTRG
jgi:DNA-binding HxlR family transcriptional regulator